MKIYVSSDEERASVEKTLDGLLHDNCSREDQTLKDLTLAEVIVNDELS